jgi:hypothetical protein
MPRHKAATKSPPISPIKMCKWLEKMEKLVKNIRDYGGSTNLLKENK